jgi:hypothetical protein
MDMATEGNRLEHWAGQDGQVGRYLTWAGWSLAGAWVARPDVQAEGRALP